MLPDEIPQAPASKCQPLNRGDAGGDNPFDGTPLHAAARDNDASLAESFLASGHYVDAKDESGVTPLVLAINLNHFNVATILMDYEADMYAVDPKSQKTVLGIIFDRPSSLPPAIVARAVHALRDCNIAPNVKAALLVRAECHLELVTYFKNSPLTAMFLKLKPDGDGDELYAALQHTMMKTDIDNVYVLLKYGFKWAALAAVVFYRIVLHYANSASSMLNRLAVIYLEKLSPWHLVNKHTFEFFRAAFSDSSEDCIRTLLNCKVNEPFRDKYGEDLVAHVFGNTHFRAVLVMFNRQFDANARGAAGYTGLHFAVRSNSADNVRFLLERGASIDLKNERDRTPLVEAVVHYRQNLVMLLLQNGADIRAVLHPKTPRFDPFSNTFCLVLQEQIIAQLVLSEVLGVQIEPAVRKRMDSNKRCMDFYHCFHMQISDIKCTQLVGSLSLFTAITGSIEEIAPHVMHVDIDELVKNFESNFQFHYFFNCALKEQLHQADKLNDIRRGYWSICPE
ncbi:ankyrin-2-like [Phymastichus coffea]|uniref:ankyrin-2-like n=1 Tax=Phymastichus coffea TaxID=108790 RepID=UPI00273ACE9B|nr:ankyrin-2-like [Phymastichus coffea]XP_058794815.1 ankyrin-2-like [Phymastichus coffea]XP_058809678.1 ankyrin-2-like [Phymastichus coffea]XP_058809679.1 ankyrin-2-like [Phymastichus coffea]